MKKHFRRQPGAVFAVPLPTGGYGYGRVLDKLMAFYDVRTCKISSVEDIIKCSVLFTTAVHISALTSGNWLLIGYAPLESKFRSIVRFFRKNPSGPGFMIYESVPTPANAYNEFAASAKDCRGLEPLLVWDADQIGERLEDHFSGRKNIHLSQFLEQLEAE